MANSYDSSSDMVRQALTKDTRLYLLVSCGLIILIHPLFHFILSRLPGIPPDSLFLRLLVAGFCLVVGIVTWLRPLDWIINCLLQVAVAVALLMSTTALVVDSGSNHMYVAAGLITVFGAHLAFVRIKDIAATFLLSVAFHLIYILAASPAGTQDWVAFAINISAYAISFVFAYLRISNRTSELRAKQELAEKNLELEELSITDRLTGLFNRLKLDYVLCHEVQRASRSESPFSVIIVDLDDFKSINDLHGHLVGDEVLVGLSELFEDNTRASDIVGRWGGEEFLIVCPDTELAGAKVLAEKLRVCTAEHEFPIAGQITASFGLTQFQEGETDDTMISRADDALYAAKKMGRNQVVAA